MIFNKNKCWYKFNIDTSNALSYEGKELVSYYKNIVSSNNYQMRLWKEKDLKYFSNDFLQKLESIGIEISASLFFCRPPNYVSPKAHVDMAWQKPVPFGLNFLATPNDNSHMVWYETIKVDNTKSQKGYIGADAVNKGGETSFVDRDIPDLIEIDRCCIGNQLTLVRTDVYHSVEMQNNERCCISLRPAKLYNLSWEETVLFFNSSIIN